MNLERIQGSALSVLLHLVLFIILYFGLPHFTDDVEISPRVITAEILPMSELTNVRPQQEQQSEQEKPKAEPKKETTPTKQEKTEVKEKEYMPEKPKEDPIQKKIEEEKKKEDDAKKAKKQQDELEAILRNVEKTAKTKDKEPSKDQGAEKGQQAKSEKYDASAPLTLSERDFIRQQIQKCWNVPAGARDAQNLVVNLGVDLNRDGSLQTVEILDTGRYNTDSFYRAAADSAVRAVRLCSPLKGLPPEKYGSWGSMELTFDPRDMLQ